MMSGMPGSPYPLSPAPAHILFVIWDSCWFRICIPLWSFFIFFSTCCSCLVESCLLFIFTAANSSLNWKTLLIIACHRGESLFFLFNDMEILQSTFKGVAFCFYFVWHFNRQVLFVLFCSMNFDFCKENTENNKRYLNI